jgi:hypothetical protein
MGQGRAVRDSFLSATPIFPCANRRSWIAARFDMKKPGCAQGNDHGIAVEE